MINKDNPPLISVVIPCYNVENYISECIDSIIFQNLDDIEIICLDDNSSDNTLAVLKGLSKNDKRIKVFSFKENKGAGALRNIGIAKAKGEWIVFCDSDDWFEEGIFKKLQKVISNVNKNINIIEYNYNISVNKFEKKNADWLNRGNSGIKEVKSINIMLATGNGNKLYRRNFLKKYNLKNCENNMSGEEIPMVICAYKLSKEIYYLNETGYNWRVNPKSTSRSRKNNKKFLSNIFLMTDFLKTEMNRLKIYNDDEYHKICRTIYNWSVKQKRDLSPEFFHFYLKCNKLYKSWKLKKNKPYLFVFISLLFKKLKLFNKR